MTQAPSPTFERFAFFAIVGCLGLIQLTIQAETLLWVAALLWLVVVWRARERPDVPGFFLPLLVLAALTLVSAAFSDDPADSFLRSRQLLIYLVVPLTMRFVRGPRATMAVNTIIAVGATSALVGIVQYALLGFDDLAHRPHGLLGHYMTYSGVLMLVICAAMGRLVSRAQPGWEWPAVALPALLVALAVSESRNAWVGALLAIICVFALRSWKLLVALPAIVVVCVVLAPVGLRHRALSIFDPNDPSTRDRIEMLKAGRAMITAHPLTGVGLNRVRQVYPQYRSPGAQPLAAHLHNVPVQLAAERGLPALGAWVWFVAVAFRDLLRQARRGPAQPIAAAGLAALVATVAAGLFEHNFGDSEFLILFLGLITLPFAAAARSADGPPAAAAALDRAIPDRARSAGGR